VFFLYSLIGPANPRRTSSRRFKSSRPRHLIRSEETSPWSIPSSRSTWRLLQPKRPAVSLIECHLSISRHTNNPPYAEAPAPEVPAPAPVTAPQPAPASPVTERKPSSSSVSTKAAKPAPAVAKTGTVDKLDEVPEREPYTLAEPDPMDMDAPPVKKSCCSIL
jgi:hypothetical protein